MKTPLLAVGMCGLLSATLAIGCGGDDDEAPPANGSAGAAGASAGSGGAKAGTGGATAGSGGTSAGSGGTSAGSGGASAGSGGATAGSGGTAAGSGGATAGSGGATAGSGGATAGSGGATAGSGGAAAGSGSGGAGAGGAAAGSGGAGGAPPVDFSCVPVTGADPKPTSTTVTFDFYVTDYGTKKPIEGYVLKACKKDDAACATPLDTKTSDATGKVTFAVTVDAAGPGFDGYIDATDPLQTKYYPTLYAWGNHAAVGQLAGGATWSVSVFPTGLFSAATAIGGVTVEKANGHGHVLHVTRDCAWLAASGVSVAASAGADAAKTVTRYTAGSGLSQTATVTSESGASFVFNLLAGVATIDAQVPSNQGAPNLLLGGVTVPVRQDVLTVTSWYPKPIPTL
ncbi:MAG: hypothetical protein IT374_05630 [Polyangiaceae bacterium]|nr:hypothetical protein [Polyangiaceae bacterium]